MWANLLGKRLICLRVCLTEGVQYLVPDQPDFWVFGAGSDEGLSSEGNPVEVSIGLDEGDFKSKGARNASSPSHCWSRGVKQYLRWGDGVSQESSVEGGDSLFGICFLLFGVGPLTQGQEPVAIVVLNGSRARLLEGGHDGGLPGLERGAGGCSPEPRVNSGRPPAALSFIEFVMVKPGCSIWSRTSPTSGLNAAPRSMTTVPIFPPPSLASSLLAAAGTIWS